MGASCSVGPGNAEKKYSTSDGGQQPFVDDGGSTAVYLTRNDPEGQINQQTVPTAACSASPSSSGLKIDISGGGTSPGTGTNSGKIDSEHDEKRSEFVNNLAQGKIQTTKRDKAGFNFRRSATAQRIVEDPDNKEVFQKRRTTVYASTEMGIKQEFHAPFPPHILGTFSCHGIAPAEEEEPDDVMRMLGGGGGGGGVYQKVNQDRGCVVYPLNAKAEEAFFAVFDGHGDQGDRVAEFVMRDLVHRLEKGLAGASSGAASAGTLTNGANSTASVGAGATTTDSAAGVPAASGVDPVECLKATYKATNQALKAEKSIKAMASGTTVVSVYVKGNKLYVANVGDSRAVLAVSRGGLAEEEEGEGDEALNSAPFSPGHGGYAGSDIIGAMSPMLSKMGGSPAEGVGPTVEGEDPGEVTPPMVTSHSTRITKTVTSCVAVMPRCEPCDAFMMTVDHKPDDPAERSRIIASRGHVSLPPPSAVGRTFAGQTNSLPEKEGSSSYGASGASFNCGGGGPSGIEAGSSCSARVWLDAAHTLVGLAMSRSIGDFAVKTVGVIPTPDVYVHEMTPQDRFMILASDGVWEFIDNQEAVDIVQRNLHLGAFTACQVLIQQAEKRWRVNEGDYRDDITAIVVVFPFFPSATIMPAKSSD